MNLNLAANNRNRAVLQSLSTLFLFSTLCAATFCAYYYTLTSGNTLTDWLDSIRPKEEQIHLTSIRLLLAAVPAFCVNLSIGKQGHLTKFGRTTVALLIPTFAIATFSSVVLNPSIQSPSSEELAILIARLSSSISGTSLAILLAVYGFKKLGGTS